MPPEQDPRPEFRYDRHAAFRKVTVDQLSTPASPFGHALAAADRLVGSNDPDDLLRRAVEILREDLGLERCGVFLLDEPAGLYRGTWGTGADGSTTDEHHVSYAADDTTVRLRELMAGRSHHWCLMNDAQLVDYAAADPDRVVLPRSGWVAATSIASSRGFRGFLFNDTASTSRPPDPFQQEAAAMFCALLGSHLEIKEGEAALRRANADLEIRVEERTRELATEVERRHRDERRLEAILASLDEAIVAWDGEGRVRLCNRAARHLLSGIDPADFAELRGILPLREADSDAPAWDRLLGPDRGRILPVRRPGGDERALEAVASPVGGETGGFVLALRDRTELEGLRRERERSERLSGLAQVVGGIAHDFNNILMALQGRLALALREAPPGLARHLEPASGAAHRAERLVDQLLTLVRGQRPARRAVRPEAVLEAALEIARTGSRLEIVRTGEAELPLLLADPTQLGQVFLNLAINARQAMERGGEEGPHRLEIEAARLERSDGSWLRLEFRDHGPGIPPDLLERVFEPLFTTRPEGHGLGLATCQTIVDHHGGFLALENAPGGGARARLLLPLAPPGTPDPDSDRGQEMSSTVGGRILVVDDQPDILETLRALLEVSGFAVAACATGEEAVEVQRRAVAAGEPWLLLLLDRHLRGGMDCLAARQAVQELHPPLRCLVMSGDPEDPVMQAPSAYGFASSLPKPFGQIQLCQALERLRG